jgi:NAD+ synthase (glutamine-hydrolysing)
LDSELFPHGIFRIAAVSPKVSVANPRANAEATIECHQSHAGVDLVLFPELGLTGYTCGDLFASDALLDEALDALAMITRTTQDSDAVVVVGLPMRVGTSLMNVAAVLARGRICGLVPKSYLPTYREFYEGRHFRGASSADPSNVLVHGVAIPFGTDLLFCLHEATIAIEICEDLWTPISPSSWAAAAGANVLLNLSASNETVGKASWRRDLVRSQSGRCIAAYAYASSGAGESTSDVVFGAHCLIAENGVIIGESRRIGDGEVPIHFDKTSVVCDIDLQRLAHDRQIVGSFDDVDMSRHRAYRRIDAGVLFTEPRALRSKLKRRVDGHPFVPDESGELEARCAEIFAIQTAGLVKRLSRVSATNPLAIGISGGLDSTLALLVALRACEALDRSAKCIHGVTMPGFGTTSHTHDSADQLITLTGLTKETIDIRALCLDTFRAIQHHPLGISIDETTTVDSLQVALQNTPDDASDLKFENVQARIRTMLLMSRGFVLGTGDMSEQALGWSTYNADHMSMYNVNTSIPKTLVRFLVRFAADHYFDGKLREVLHRIADTPISPELMPPASDGSLRQSTEATIGDYELHDFFLYHFVRYGASFEKILYLAEQATFSRAYTSAEVEATLRRFLERFFVNQFKRNCVPDGPKVGSVSLSPRGDWRMPSDADVDAFRPPKP